MFGWFTFIACLIGIGFLYWQGMWQLALCVSAPIIIVVLRFIKVEILDRIVRGK